MNQAFDSELKSLASGGSVKLRGTKRRGRKSSKEKQSSSSIWPFGLFSSKGKTKKGNSVPVFISGMSLLWFSWSWNVWWTPRFALCFSGLDWVIWLMNDIFGWHFVEGFPARKLSGFYLGIPKDAWLEMSWPCHCRRRCHCPHLKHW